MTPPRPTILVTGFEPFGGEAINPSWETASRLDGREIGGSMIVARRLPVVFGEAAGLIAGMIESLRPAIVIATGQAGGRAAISVERVAINLDSSADPDNAGRMPAEKPIVEGGPAAYFSTLPVARLAGMLQAAGIPAAVSNSAGTFVCNHVFYAAAHLAATRYPAMRVGFLHVPFSAEQAASRPGTPSMTIGMIADGIERVVGASVAELAGGVRE